MKTFAFDLGRVIFDFDYNIALDKIKDKVQCSSEKIIDEIFYKDFGADFEKGLVSSQEFFNKFKVAFRATIQYQEFTHIWSDIFSPMKKTINLIKYLKAKHPLFMISNITELHYDFLYQRYPEVFALFDGLILSYQVQSVKPEEKIYQALKTLAKTEYEEIIYIDDRPDLICEAKKLKLNCIQFQQYEQLVEELKELGIAID
ncbi:MAG: HAD family hydrolase [Candidatus Omnitrophota bacterium]|nr:HAD hydrolase-like protein [Candidatus Omnitrophota bacterium]